MKISFEKIGKLDAKAFRKLRSEIGRPNSNDSFERNGKLLIWCHSDGMHSTWSIWNGVEWVFEDNLVDHDI